jgi:Domain of unknown function (DUF5703)
MGNGYHQGQSGPVPAPLSGHPVPMISRLMSLLLCGLTVLGAVTAPDTLDTCDTVWTTPSKDSRGSMPLGNGDVALNVWTEA